MTYIPNVTGIISTNNATTTPLNASQTYTGTADEVTEFSTVTVSVCTDQNSVDNGLQMQFSSDGIDWGISYDVSVLGGISFTRTLTCVARYFRVVYTNGGTNQTEFCLQTIYSTGKSNKTTHRQPTGELVQLSPMELYTQNIENTDREVVPTASDFDGNMCVRIMDPLSAFGKLATSSSYTVSGLTFQYNINTALVTPTTTGSATITQSGNEAILSTGTTTGSTAVLTGNRILTYIPGKGVDIKFTAIFGTPVAGTTQYIGYGTSDDGFFYGYNGTTFGILRRSGGVDNFIPQNTWNGDKMDGTGPSKQTLVQTNGNVYNIKFQWLGYGAQIFFIENTYTGLFQRIHTIRYANTATATSLINPNGTLRVETDNGATTSDITIKTSSMALSYDEQPQFFTGAFFSAGASITVGNAVLQNVLSLRNKTTFASKTNYTPVGLILLSMASAGNKTARIEVRLNPVFGTTPTWTDVSTNQSVMEYSSTVVNVTNGNTIGVFYLQANDSKIVELSQYRFDILPGYTVSFAAFTSNATNENSVSVSWVERF